jgi:hypothetical protein
MHRSKRCCKVITRKESTKSKQIKMLYIIINAKESAPTNNIDFQKEKNLL